MKNLCLQFSECRKVTHTKMFKCSHTFMLKQNLGWVTEITELTEKFGKLNQQKICVSSFLSVNRNWISLLAIMKKLINGCHFININHTEKFQITDPSTKFGSLVFRVSTDMEYHWKIGDANFLFSEFSIGLFFPVTHPRFHFNIYAWLHLEHLCVDIYASLVYLTSHLCVVLHFLIFYLGTSQHFEKIYLCFCIYILILIPFSRFVEDILDETCLTEKVSILLTFRRYRHKNTKKYQKTCESILKDLEILCTNSTLQVK